MPNQNLKLKIFFLTILFLAIFGVSAKASAATYYVKNGGNDSLSGLDDANAWETIDKVEATVTSGDTVYFRSQDVWTSATTPVLVATAGVIYDGSIYGSGTRATFKATGNLAYVIFIGQSNVTVRSFNVDMNSQITDGITIYGADKSNIIIDDCQVHDNICPEGNYVYGVRVSAQPSTAVSDVLISNTNVYNTGHEAFVVYSGGSGIESNIILRNCSGHDSGQDGSTWGSGLAIKNDARNVIVEFSSFYNSASNGISIIGENGSPTGLDIKYNIIYNNGDHGITVYDVDSAGVAVTGGINNNLIYSNGSNEIYLGGDLTGTVLNFYNNTLFADVYSAINLRWAIGTPIINFKNNIACSDNYQAVYDYLGLLTHSNNLIFRSSSDIADHVVTNINYNRSDVLTWEPTAQTTDPNFTGGTLPTGFNGTYGTNMLPNTNYFATTSGPTINTGATLGSPYNLSINSAGLSSPFLRPVGAYDIGAYEYQGTDTTPPTVPSGLAVE